MKRAGDDSNRPGGYNAEPATWQPIVDRTACEGKRDCVAVCPYDVFEVRRIEPSDFAVLSLIGNVKLRVHAMQTAYTPRADACKACGLCVVASPEQAIALVRL